ncbi:MAG: NADH-quinone oxidoreductase subunit L [Gammaproteobacteria bacterium]|nr:NADH-quinone oxidoreductase subunit L [Gammaproteobacteria bacterium]
MLNTDMLILACVAPLVGFVLLGLARGRIPENLAALLGVGSVGIAALATLNAGWQFFDQPPAEGFVAVNLWTWMQVGNFAPAFTLRLDALSLVMMGVITGVGFFIHLFASWYMRGDPGYTRFFAYMNLFIASMLFLVLGDDLLFLYLGWEGVGLASYLLIGFWYQDPANGLAARKAFLVTRVGDTLLAIGLFLLYREFGTLNIQELATNATLHWAVGSPLATITALLILGGAVGKSAQLPLQTWLADAMAGPTPVSALIHAATMVTAGVYLIARTHALFALAPFAQHLVAVIGALTLLLAGFTALVQTDIKKILAYSTMSQIGYMFLAEGVGAYGSAVFHLMTHAFFKALLFLAAGSVILALHHEQDIFRMGGLRKRLPFVFACMLVGTFALTAFPFTAGYYSKDEILHQVYLSGHHELWVAGLVGAFLTALYSFRLIFIVFFGAERFDTGHGTPQGARTLDHHLPLAVLLVLALGGGLLQLPLAAMLATVLPAVQGTEVETADSFAEQLPLLVSLAGIALAWLLFVQFPRVPAALAQNSIGAAVARLWRSAWGFDWLYDRLLTRPFVAVATLGRNDVADRLLGVIPATLRGANALLAWTQTGNLRWYAAVAGFGTCLLLALVALR